MVDAKDIAKKIYAAVQPPARSLNLSRKIEELLRLVGAEARVLEIGSGTKRQGPRVINLDCQSYANVNIVGDALMLPVKEGSLDAVIAQAVLEHVRDPIAAVAEIGRVLKKGGYIYAEIPFLQPFHPSPSDYQRYTIQGIENLFKGFEKIETGVCVGPTAAVCSILREYVPFAVGIPVIRSILYVILGWVFFPARYLDLLLARRKNAHILASSLYFFGRK